MEKIMKPTEILKSEHRVIEQVLNCLEKITSIAIRDRQLDTKSAYQAVDFFRNFADKCHHDKEESHLFPLMEKKGFSRESGPTGVMLVEHEQGRAFVRGMKESIDAVSQGNREALKSFAENAHSYIQLLRQHIQKEDHCLFTMADQSMTDEDQKYLHSMFDRVEKEEMGENTHQKYLDIAHELADKYQVQHAELSQEVLSCSCHH